MYIDIDIDIDIDVDIDWLRMLLASSSCADGRGAIKNPTTIAKSISKFV